MRILLIGATGRIGSRILAEAASRGHDVTAVARDRKSLVDREHVKVVEADAKDVELLASLAAGHDAVASATSPRASGGPEQYLGTVRAVLEAARRAAAPYVLFVGGAASLEAEPGKTLLDWMAERTSGERPMEPTVVVQAWDVVSATDVSWTYVTPAFRIEPGERTGRFRVGARQPVTDAPGTGRISMEDFAVAVVDDLERRAHLRQHWNVAY